MNKFIIALIGASVLAISGCAGTTQTASAPTNGTLSSEAKTALAQAQADVAAAKKHGDLWTNAANALKAAEAAAKAGDSATVIKDSKTASDAAKLGIEQASLPSTDQFK